MGKATRIIELEIEIENLKNDLKNRTKQLERMEHVLKTLADIIPEDSYALYTKFGNRVSIEIDQAVKSALMQTA